MMSTITTENSLRVPGITAIAISIVLLYIAYGTSLGIYRVWFSPLSKVPGPWLAAATQWYEIYYELVSGGGGMFTKKIKQLHEKYGPIVRINPNEVHIDDPEYYETIYTTSQHYDKLVFFENRFNNPRSTFMTAHADIHKHRRKALAPFFATGRVRAKETFVQGLVDRITTRMKNEYSGQNKVLVLNDVFGCLTCDVITNLAFARSYNFIETEKWESPFTLAVRNLVHTVHWTTQFAWIVPAMNCIPDKVLGALVPAFKPIIDFRREMAHQVRDVLAGNNRDTKEASQRTAFLDIIDSDLPPHELSFLRLQDEAMSVVGAGFETTRWVLSVSFYHILANPSINKRLRSELNEAIPNPDQIPSWAALQELPYLSACIEEALRIAYGIVQRSPRMSRHSSFEYKGYVLPPGTGVSSDPYHMHHHEEIFQDSYAYKPERWLGQPKGPDGVKPLTRYNAAFGRGTRICLGMALAYCEIYITLASLFRRCDFELHETTLAAVAFHHDMVTAQPAYGQKGVRVLVK